MAAALLCSLTVIVISGTVRLFHQENGYYHQQRRLLVTNSEKEEETVVVSNRLCVSFFSVVTFSVSVAVFAVRLPL